MSTTRERFGQLQRYCATVGNMGTAEVAPYAGGQLVLVSDALAFAEDEATTNHTTIDENTVELLLAAVQYTLDRAQTDPEFRWHMLSTEAMARLVKAEAAYLGQPESDVMRTREQDRQPEYRRRKAECSMNRERVRLLEGLLEDSGIAYPER
jgi:hypothetical protein